MAGGRVGIGIIGSQHDASALAAASSRCLAYMAREYSEERILAPYLAAFEELTCNTRRALHMLAAGGGQHV